MFLLRLLSPEGTREREIGRIQGAETQGGSGEAAELYEPLPKCARPQFTPATVCKSAAMAYPKLGRFRGRIFKEFG